MCRYKFQIITVQSIILVMIHLRILSYKKKEKIGNLLKDLVPSINTSQIQDFSKDKGHEQWPLG